MSTANKLTYLNDTKQKLKQAINNIGGEVTDETTFREYVNQLDGVYDVLPKTEFQEGTEVTIENGLKGKIDFAKMYQEVEYIESDGNQYINTGKKLTSNNLKVQTKIYTPDMPLNEQNIVSNYENDTNRFSVGLFNYQIFAYNANNTNVATGGFSGSQTFQIEAIYDSTTETKTLNVNDTEYEGGFTANIANNDYIYLLDNGQHNKKFIGRLYYLKLYDNDVLKLDLVPCYRKSDNVIGLYDKVEGKFYTNSGTGTFTKGADVGNGFDEIVGFGQASQESTQGYNLANLNGMNTTTNNGVTFTINKENGLTKSVKINGTSVNYDSYCIGTAYLLPAGTYVVYGNGVTNNIITQIVNDTQTAQLGYSGKDDNTMTLEQDTNIIIRLRVTVGATINNIEVKPIIATTSGKDFEPYTGGQASPNPSYPQEIKCVRGKNLLKLANGTYTSGNVSAVVNNGIITLNGTSGSSVSTIAIPFTTTLNGEYTLSANNEAIGTSSNWTGMRLKENSSTTISSTQIYFITANASATFTLENKAVQVFELRLGTSVTYTNYIIKPQLEEGTQATPYLPYNTIEEVVSGKNRFDKDNITFYASNSTDFNGVDASNKIRERTNSIAIASVGIKTNTTYKISGLPSGWTLLGLGTFTQENGTNTSQATTNNNTFIINDSNVKYIFYLFSNNNSTEVATDLFNNANIQVEEGSTATTYEPYITPTSYQFSLGDHKFYNIGDYADELLYDVENDKVYKKAYIEEIHLTKNINWIGQVFNNVYRVNTDAYTDILLPLSESTSSYVKSNMYIAGWATVFGGLRSGYIGIYTNSNIYICTHFTTSNMQGWKDFLDANDVVVVAPRKEPLLTELTDTTLHQQVKNWYYSQSFTGTTIIESNGDLPMIIKVRALKGE